MKLLITTLLLVCGVQMTSFACFCPEFNYEILVEELITNRKGALWKTGSDFYIYNHLNKDTSVYKELFVNQKMKIFGVVVHHEGKRRYFVYDMKTGKSYADNMTDLNLQSIVTDIFPQDMHPKSPMPSKDNVKKIAELHMDMVPEHWARRMSLLSSVISSDTNPISPKKKPEKPKHTNPQYEKWNNLIKKNGPIPSLRTPMSHWSFFVGKK